MTDRSTHEGDARRLGEEPGLYAPGTAFDPTLDMPVRDHLRAVADMLAEDATWEEARYILMIREAVDRGRRESRAGHVISHEDVGRTLGLIDE